MPAAYTGTTYRPPSAVPVHERRTGHTYRPPSGSRLIATSKSLRSALTVATASLGLIWQLRASDFRPNMAAARLSRPNLAAASLVLYGYMRSSTLLPGASVRSPCDLLRAISKRSPSDLQAISVRSPPRDLSEAGLRLCARHGALDPQQLIGHRGELLRLVERL